MLETVKNQIYSIMLVSLATGAAMIFSPTTDHGIGKYIKYVISLIIIITLLTPFTDILYMIPKVLSDEMFMMNESYDISEENTVYDEIIKMTLNKISNGISEQIKKDFQTEVAKIDIEIDGIDMENIQITGISIILEETKTLQTALIQQELEDQYNCPIDCKVKIEEGGEKFESS